MARPTRHATRTPARGLRLAALVLGISSILVGLMLVGRMGWFYARSETVGRALVGRETTAIEHARAVPSACHPQRTGRVRALLRIPSIGLVAPVVPGVADPQLNVAVGHVGGSPWPGQVGTSLLAAHDVTWFHHLPSVRVGAEIEYETPCRTLVYRVTSARVVGAGAPLRDVGRRLVLETCYPLDALYYTPQRYLVYARLADETGWPRVVAAPTPSVRPPRVPAPPGLVAEGITLAANPTPLGSLTTRGRPAPTWSESPAPLAVATAAHELLFAAVRAASGGKRSWWVDLAPRVPFAAAAPLRGALIASHTTSLQTTLVVRGSRLRRAVLRMGVVLAGGARPGRFLLRVTETLRGGALHITAWRMTPS